MLFNEILLRRKNKINIDNFRLWSSMDNIEKIIMLCKNINSLGYTLSKGMIEHLKYVGNEEFYQFYNELIDCLKKYKGADKDWTPFYPNFPVQVEQASDWELFINAVITYLSDGKLVPDYEKDPRLPLFENSDLTVIDVGTNDDLKEILNNLVSSKTSLSEQDKEDMISLIEQFGVETLPDEIPFKENVAVICKLIMEHTNEIYWYDILHKYLKTATDILRFYTYLSDGDVSLSNRCEYKSLPRKQRKLFLQLLENCGSIEEDMKRYIGRWVILGEKLHPGEYKNQYPKVYTAFDKLRNNGKIYMFNGKVNDLIEKNDLCGVVNLLKTRPGEFARRLDYLLRTFKSSSDYIYNKFKDVANDVAVPVLLQVREHFANRWVGVENKNNFNNKVFFPKGQLTKCWVTENNLDSININVCAEVIRICENAIIDQFELKEDLGFVYVSDSIKGYCVPQSQRSASSTGMKFITRGSRFGIKDDSKFIRLGIHWMNEIVTDSWNKKEYEERTDIDLSCNFLDENFSYMDHISYTHLRNNYSVHSGDYVDAPRDKGGSSEFIDIDINKALSQGIRYAVVQVYGYTMTKFCELEDMLFGWQEGIDQQAGEVFHPSRLQHCVNLSGDTICSIPVVFDLKTRETIWADLALNTNPNFPRCVEGNVKGVAATVMGIVQSHKPQMWDLANMHTIARGVWTSNRDEADTIFDVDTTKPIIKTEKFIEIQNEKGEVIGTRVDVEEKEKDCRIISPFDLDVWYSEML